MYESHFGLERRPFSETVHPSAYIPITSRESVVRRVRYGLEQGQGPVLIFGPPGSGKTLISRVISQELGGASAHVTFPALPPLELLKLLAQELGVEIGDDASPASALRRLRDWLSGCSARGIRPLLVVDEAHLIEDVMAFETLRLLLNFATQGPSDLALLLVGGAEALLRMPPSLMDRLSARCLLGAFTESESASYVMGQLEAAGATSPLFDSESLAILHRAADGLPRRLNRLADLALLIAYAEGHSVADGHAVAIASREFELDPMIA
ncbi:ExeA family protein [Singulisphaera sp. PoT]|uniref:ExeA family protein n=1 Tax=Singulisphaera sp. PoT TaxID=3411797 RepID=UPI003BF4762E